ncbi:unnamed protein product [Porites evermanni]|uniref:Uncharacterized protein n=1 Tax=Porites evermanni TaxID=104178 RepID=A0ABN8RDP1_9CNID|nr:unnamed protein product [Porites evermanni]
MAEKPDFFYEDFANGATVIGNWQGKNYIIKMQIKTLKLDLKVVVRETGSWSSELIGPFHKKKIARFSNDGHFSGCLNKVSYE